MLSRAAAGILLIISVPLQVPRPPQTWLLHLLQAVMLEPVEQVPIRLVLINFESFSLTAVLIGQWTF